MSWNLELRHQKEYLQPLVEKISSFNKSKLKTVEYISKSRTAYLPYSCIILDEIMKVTNPRNIICSISGLREGSLSIDYFKDVKESEIFHKALENIAKKRGAKIYLRVIAIWKWMNDEEKSVTWTELTFETIFFSVGFLS